MAKIIVFINQSTDRQKFRTTVDAPKFQSVGMKNKS